MERTARVPNRVRFAQTRARLRRSFRIEEWAIGVIDLPVAEWIRQAIQAGSVPDVPIRWLEWPGSGWFVADPIAFEDDGDQLVAFEIFDPWVSRGRIGLGRLAACGVQFLGCPIDDPAVHYAYPSMIRDGTEWYCVTDSSRRCGLEVFQVVPAPRWDLIGLLPGVPHLSDPTLWTTADGLWLAGTEGPRGDERLRCFYAASLFSQWLECADSPIPSNSMRRSAGPTVLVDDMLIRPTQDCRYAYGERINFNQVVQATPDRFDEVHLASIGAPQAWTYGSGIHTVSGVGPWTVIDAVRLRSSAIHLAQWATAQAMMACRHRFGGTDGDC